MPRQAIEALRNSEQLIAALAGLHLVGKGPRLGSHCLVVMALMAHELPGKIAPARPGQAVVHRVPDRAAIILNCCAVASVTPARRMDALRPTPTGTQRAPGKIS